MSETRIPEALALLREKGWCKGRYNGPNGSHCIAGAMLNAHRTTPSEISHAVHPDRVAILNVIHAQYRRMDSVADFNDDPATTFADVEFVLEKAILERGGAL